MKQMLLLIFLLVLTNGCVTKTDLADAVSDINLTTRMAVATNKRCNQNLFGGYGKVVKIEKVPAEPKFNCLAAEEMVCYYILPIKNRNTEVPEMNDSSNCIIYKYYITHCENPNSGPTAPNLKKGDTVRFRGNINKTTP